MPENKKDESELPRPADPFKLRDPKSAAADAQPMTHLIRKGVRCGTEKRGSATPNGKSPAAIRVDSSAGFIPLWGPDVTLRWRFQERSMQYFADAKGAGDAIEELLGEALLGWGDAMPVRFAKRDDAWDFEIVMSATDDCDANGCVLAQAFFPDAGRHELWLYPKLFTQSHKEQIETLEHEIGHVFGLRHFFANVSETDLPSELFGRDERFSIMNYGDESDLTDTDRRDLRLLYEGAWGGTLTEINGTPIRLVRPFHESGVSPAALRLNVSPSDGGPFYPRPMVAAAAGASTLPPGAPSPAFVVFPYPSTAIGTSDARGYRR